VCVCEWTKRLTAWVFVNGQMEKLCVLVSGNVAVLCVLVNVYMELMCV